MIDPCVSAVIGLTEYIVKRGEVVDDGGGARGLVVSVVVVCKVVVGRLLFSEEVTVLVTRRVEAIIMMIVILVVYWFWIWLCTIHPLTEFSKQTLLSVFPVLQFGEQRTSEIEEPEKFDAKKAWTTLTN